MDISSTGIDSKGKILPEHSRAGGNINPALTFSQIPDRAQSLALIMEDPDVPQGTFTHWLLYDMSPTTIQVVEGSVPPGAKTGTNDFGRAGYDGPQPPSGIHRYYFRIIALDTMLDLPEGVTRKELDAAMDHHVIGFAEIMGIFATTNQ